VLSEISATCDRIIVISDGKIVADAKTDELSVVSSGQQKLALVVEGAAATITSTISKIPAVNRVSKVQDMREGTAKYMVDYETGIDIRREVFNAMARIDCPILDMQSGNETLEDMFLKLTSGQAAGYSQGGVK
jgi:ABC-2 type transport system ATP-binding protein